MNPIDNIQPSLLGRGEELERLAVLVSSARNGHGSALLLRGEAGIGKTTLLEAAMHDLAGVRVVRSDGFEAESAMPYAMLQRLGTPFTHLVPALPRRQASALRIAAGVDEGPPPDRYLVGLGMLSLLAAAAEREPVVCVVDDAHLSDPESLEVLAFVARRLKAEAVAIVLSARPDPRVDRAVAGIASLELGGLDPQTAVQVLNRSATDQVDPYLAMRFAEETGGNPLALTDLAREFTAQQLTDSSLGLGPVPIGQRLESTYLRAVEALPADTRRWLGIVAAESTGDPALIDDAARRLAVSADASGAAESAGLATSRDRVRFRHPLVRAAVYNAMTATERRRVHEALESVAGARGRPDLAVWHAAEATLGIDDDVADRLELAADAAGGRGGTVSRARLLARAADLSSRGPEREARLVAAAEAAAVAGAARFATEMLDRIDPTALDPVTEGRVLMLRAMLALFVADPEGVSGGTEQLLRAAGLFHGRAPELEQRALLGAFNAELTSESTVRSGSLQALGRRLATGAGVTDGRRSLALRALGAHILQPYPEAAPIMRAAVAMLQDSNDAQLLELGSEAVALTMALWDEQTCVELLERTVRAATEAGNLRVLDTTLWVLGLLELVRGDPAASGRYVEQVRELRRAIGYDAEQVVNASYLAWSGAPPELVEQIAEATLLTGFAGVWTIAMTGLSIREIADGHYRDAYERLRPMVEHEFLQVTYQQLPDLVEAGVRSGNVRAARAAADRLAEFATASGTPWIRGISARAEALLAEPEQAEARYVEAIEHFGRATAPGELARAHLLYGEWLRRMKRRREARDELRSALAIFERVGAPAFAARARRELEATGEHVLAHETGDGPDRLTPQEDAVARLASAGRTNAEIGAELFISANTVDYHLRKVFRKLGITSRKQLTERMPAR
ncbi:DNA-binding CsgD family transcriptional regulator [Agromyces cerinus]|uniref:helix-turn-helix transcriptional regulator n=1 Tax=Agromyces cerinus TaxID=33878 RepID=UPI0027DAFB67|nr:AAA family ATPase [Agromyces cerinus]MBM7830343.1 DNA-binding CsgD family transcriptional regulator [Agromyces cerinus]